MDKILDWGGYATQFPEVSTLIVSIIEFQGAIIIATPKQLFRLQDGKLELLKFVVKEGE